MKYEPPELIPMLPAIDAIQCRSVSKSYVTWLAETSITHNDVLPGYLDWED